MRDLQAEFEAAPRVRLREKGPVLSRRLTN